MANYFPHILNYPDDYFVIIMLVAIGVGINGIVILLRLNKYAQTGQKADKLLLATFDIVISLLSICAVMIMMQLVSIQQ
jgi:hypothetical protein